MRQSIRGWRSARAVRGDAPPPARAQVLASTPMEGALPYIHQKPFRLGLGMAAFVFYLWIVHSYKLEAGDIAILAVGVGTLIKGGTLRVPGILVAFGVFVLWAALGLAVTESNPITLFALYSLAKLWIISFFIVNVVRNAADLRFVIIAWLGIYALYPIRGALYNQFICHCTTFGRVSWNFIFENPNDLASFTLIPLGLAAAVATVERVKFWRWCGLAGVAVLALIIMLTQSRGAMLAIGAGTLMLVVTSQRRGRDLTVLALLLGGAALVAPKDVWRRLAGLSNISVEKGMQDVDPENSATSRWMIWQVAAATVQRKPLLGVGAGMMPVTHRYEAMLLNLPSTARGERDTHSTYLRIAAELGVPGLLLYLSIWGALFWHLRRVRKRIKHVRPREHQALVFIEVSMLGFMITSIFGTYGWLAFTYVGITVSWLTAAILEHEPWYVPQKALAVPPQQSFARR